MTNSIYGEHPGRGLHFPPSFGGHPTVEMSAVRSFRTPSVEGYEPVFDSICSISFMIPYRSEDGNQNESFDAFSPDDPEIYDQNIFRIVQVRNSFDQRIVKI